MRNMTYREAHGVIIEHFRVLGWTVKRYHNGRPMNVPHITSPVGDIRLWFKSQAVYQTSSPTEHKLKYARSIFQEGPLGVKLWAKQLLDMRDRADLDASLSP